MSTIFLTFYNANPVEGYSLAGNINGEFVDIDASQRFFHVPLQSPSKDEPSLVIENKIDLEIRCTHHDEAFRAIPVYFWHKGLTLPSQFYQKNVSCIYQPAQLDFFQNNGIEWIGPTDKLQTNLSIQYYCFTTEIDLANSSERRTKKDQLTINANGIDGQRLFIKHDEFLPNSWFVCYHRRSLHNFDKDRTHNSLQNFGTHLSVRMNQHLTVAPIVQQNRYNYLTIGSKTLPLDSVLFYKKIDSIWDYLNCLKMCNSLTSVHYY